MKTNQPKYITYKGAKYERVNTLNEIIVGPVPECCVLKYETEAYRYGPVEHSIEYEFTNGFAKRLMEDFVKKSNSETPPYWSGWYDDINDVPEPDEKDMYSYTWQLHEEDEQIVIVCTKGKGAFKKIYELVKRYDDADEDDVDEIELIFEELNEIILPLFDTGIND